MTDSDLMDVNFGTRKKGWVFGGELGTESFVFLEDTNITVYYLDVLILLCAIALLDYSILHTLEIKRHIRG